MGKLYIMEVVLTRQIKELIMNSVVCMLVSKAKKSSKLVKHLNAC